MSKESLGVINWWGFTPALDLFDNELLEIDECTDKADINILLVGSGDSRHILQSLSSLYKRKKCNINFYIIENGLELYARQMLQLMIALIPLNRMGLQDKTELFLELYGNGLVREQSMEFARQAAVKLIKFVTNSPGFPTALSQLIHIDNLKFKERDILEAIFKLWKDENSKSFDLSLCWDLRLRQNLGTRYDAIPNVFDWDCSITLHDRGATIINSREYSHWRHKGVAFQLRDANYDVSNRTLASGRVLQATGGDKTVRLGYWGDIVCSPFIGFGIASSNAALFQRSNNQFLHGASRVSEYNISEIFHQIACNRKYVETSNPLATATITEVDEEQQEQEQQEQEQIDDPAQYLNDLIAVPNVKLIFLPVNSLLDYVAKKTKFQSNFDLVYFSASLIGQLEACPPLAGILRPQGKLLVEMPKYIVNINADQIDRFRARVDEMAKAHSMQAFPVNCAAGLDKSEYVVYTLNQ